MGSELARQSNVASKRCATASFWRFTKGRYGRTRAHHGGVYKKAGVLLGVIRNQYKWKSKAHLTWKETIGCVTPGRDGVCGIRFKHVCVFNLQYEIGGVDVWKAFFSFPRSSTNTPSD